MRTAAIKNQAQARSFTGQKPFFGGAAGRGFFQSQPAIQRKCDHCEAEEKEQRKVQAKLDIGKPGDRYEQEADAMADRVVNIPQAQAHPAPVQRKCAECEKEEKLQRKPEEEETVQRKTAATGYVADTGIAAQLAGNKGRGRALPRATKVQMEHSFGVDFSQVAIHTDGQAVQMSRQLHAQAFTHGTDIYFNQGKYNPDSSAGKHLLAHELTHTLQQQGSIRRQPESGVSTVADEFMPGYSQCDFLDERISFEAQFALYHLYQRGGNSRAAALAMLGAVRSGQLQGIYKEDQGKPAMMAQRHGMGWWQLIPPGQGALVFEPEQPPMMVFKNNIAGNRAALADALLAAWESSAIGQQAIVIPEPSLKPCPLIPPPPPPSVPPPPQENECPPGTILDEANDICILDLPGPVRTECTDAEMHNEFQKHEDFCANVRMGIDMACNLGVSPCDLGKNFGKLACDSWERIYGKPFPLTKPPECTEPRAQYYEKCIVSSTIGNKGNMPCYPGSNAQIRDKYQKWPKRIR